MGCFVDLKRLGSALVAQNSRPADVNDIFGCNVRLGVAHAHGCALVLPGGRRGKRHGHPREKCWRAGSRHGSVVPVGGWLHLNAGLPCPDGSKANRRRDPARLREHVATFFIAVQRLRAKYRKVTWFAENVVRAEFAGTMKYEVVNHVSFSAERRKRAYFPIL